MEAEEEAREENQRDANAAVEAEIKKKREEAKETKGVVKRGKEELQELRKLCRNAMFVAVAVLCRDGLRQTVKIMAFLLRALWNAHTEAARTVRAPMAAERFYAEQAAGTPFQTLEETCSVLQRIELLNEMSFAVDFYRVPPNIAIDSELVAAQDGHARVALDIVVNLLRERLGSMLWNCHYWLGLLALMTTGHQDDEER